MGEDMVITALSRMRGALWGMYIGDALSMPVHWYYDRRRLRQEFGRITKYERPPQRFPGSIMSLSSTGGGGRGSDEGDIIGSVILHGKKEFWARGGQYHYHHGMNPGDNTLDTLVARLLLKSICTVRDDPSPTPPRPLQNFSSSAQDAVVDKYLLDYVKFMTTPGSHNDVYAATAHRMFFVNYVKEGRRLGRKDVENHEQGLAALRRCADNDGHNTDSIDGLINVLPVALTRFGEDLVVASARGSLSEPSALLDQAIASARSEPQQSFVSDVINALRRSPRKLPQFGATYNELLARVLAGQNLREAILAVAPPSMHNTLKQSVRTGEDDDPMSACYVDSNFPVTLLLAYKYADDPNGALLASANAGGENVNRSAVLGGIMGAAHGFEALDPKLVQGLTASKAIEAEVERFVARYAEPQQRSEL